MMQEKIPLAREGYPFIAIAAFLTLIFSILDYEPLAWTFLFFTGFTTAFFRDPERMTDACENEIVSPADGKVIIIDELLDDTYSEKKMIKVSIFMNVFNVHVNRTPYNGIVESIHYKPGEFYSADSRKGALLNERLGVVMRTAEGEKMVFVQIAGLIARRIVNWLEPGDVIKRTERFGLIRFGSRVDLYLPVESKILVKVGQKVRAGKSSIAIMPKRQ